MKKNLIIFLGVILGVFMSLGVFGQTVIDFETADDGYTPSSTDGSGDTDVFNRSNPDIGGNSSYIWAVEALNLSDPTLTLDQIDVSGKTSFTFSIDMLTPNTEDWDTSDELLITYSLDGGTYQNLMWVQSNDDGDAYNAPAAIDADFDGTGDDGSDLPAIDDNFGAGVGSSFETFSTGDITLSGNSTLDIKLQFIELTSTAEGIYLDDITINTVSSGSTITLSTSSFTGFSYEEGSGPSAEQTFTVEGSDLTDDIILTPPTNYEITETTGSGFGSSITLTQSGGSVSTTTIYVRLKAGLSIGTYNNEDITASSTGATDQNVTCDGEVVCPSVSAPTATAATSASGTSFTANWDAVSGATGYELDVYSSAGGVDMTADGDGSSSDPYSVSQALALSEGSTEYFVKGYIVGRGNPIAFGTPASNDYSVVLAETVDETNASNVLVAQVESADRPSWGLSTNPSLYQTGVKVEGYRNSYGGDPSFEGNSQWEALSVGGTTYHLQNSDVGNVTSYSVTGLTAGETYYYVVRAYNDCGSESANSNEITVNLSCSDPTTEATSLSFPNTQTDQMDVSWTDGNGDNRIVVASTSAITSTPADNTTYSADVNFGDGATLNAGEFVVYAGSGSTFTMTGLNSDTQYFIKVFEYNCDGGNEQYLTSSLLSGSETTPADLQPVVDLDVTCTTKTTATIEWTNPSSGDWDGVGITVRRGTNPPQVLSGFSNPSTLNVNTAFGNATSQYGDSPDYSYAIYKGTGTSVTVTGLTEGADYIFKAFSYYDDSYDNTNAVTTTSISALELNQVTSASATTENSQTSISWSNPSTCYDEILIVGHGGSSVSTAPSGDGSSYTANTTFGSGTDIGTNEYVVYKGSSTSQAVAGLTNGTTYYFTIFVRIGTEWSNGVEVITTPAEVTNFLPGDLAIIAVNTNHLTNGEEFTFVSFKDITVGTAIDFTDNGWQQENSDSWGTTEGTMRLTRISGSTLVAGTSVTVIMNSGNGDDEPDFDVNVAGTDELGTNWSISLLNNTEGTGFNLNSEDEIWMMQGGSWIENDITSSDPVNDDDEYTGYVLYGWTATGWGVGTSTKKSDLYPGCECFNTNVSGLSNQDKVKYTGLMTDATKLEWIMRFNDETNWTGYVDDASYDAATPDYRYNGVTIGILLGGFESGRWTADQNTDWFDCGNWQNLTIPDENTDVVISSSYATGDAVVNSSENALCHDISIESGIGLDFSSNTIEIHGDFLNQSGSLTTTDGTLLLAANEAVNLTTNGVSMSNVTVNGAGTLILLDDFILTGILTFTDGLIETGTHMLHVDNTNIAAISGYNTISYINGNLRRAITGAEAYDFPVGDASNYELATVDVISAASLTYLDAHFASVDLGDLNIAVLGLQIAGTPLVSLLDVGYWQIEPNTGASVNYDIEVNLAGASNAAADAAQHAVIKRDDAVSDWELQGSHDNSTQSISGGVVTAKVSGLSAFSQFAIARSSQWVLAVELVDFSVRCETAGLSVNWTTASEDNADYFMIEYSSDTRIWKTIQKLPAFGITHITQEYQMLLEDAPRKAYYRLAEVDMDGTVTHYAPAYVNCLSEDGQVVITVSPNPATDFARLAAEKTTANFYLVGIYDATGKLVNMLTWENPAEQTLKLDLNGFAPGYYQLKIYNEREFYNQKLLVK